jgi:hypothetical protein
MTSDDRDEMVFPPDPVIEYYKQFVDRAALRENLKLTVEERLEKLQRWTDEQAREAGHSRTIRRSHWSCAKSGPPTRPIPRSTP